MYLSDGELNKRPTENLKQVTKEAVKRQDVRPLYKKPPGRGSDANEVYFIHL